MCLWQSRSTGWSRTAGTKSKINLFRRNERFHLNAFWTVDQMFVLSERESMHTIPRLSYCTEMQKQKGMSCGFHRFYVWPWQWEMHAFCLSLPIAMFKRQICGIFKRYSCICPEVGITVNAAMYLLGNKHNVTIFINIHHSQLWLGAIESKMCLWSQSGRGGLLYLHWHVATLAKRLWAHTCRRE